MSRAADSLYLAALWGAILAPHLAAQDHMSWWREYGQVPGAESGYQLAVSPAGDVFVTGGQLSGPGSVTFVQAYDAFGNLRWHRVLQQGEAWNFAHLLRDPVVGDLIVGGTGGANTWRLWRVDEQTGAIVWERSHVPSGSAESALVAIAHDPTGGVLLAGAFGTVPGSSATPSVDVTSFALDGTESWSWTNTVTPPYAVSFIRGLASDPAGGAVVGITSQPGPDRIQRLSAAGAPLASITIDEPIGLVLGPRVDPASGWVYVVKDGNGDVALIKRDALGALVWSLSPAAIFGGSFGLAAVEIDASGSIYVAAALPRVAKLSPAGAVLWSTSLPDSSSIDLYGTRELAITRDGSAALLSGGASPYSSAPMPIVVSRWAPDGTFLWSQGLLGTQPDLLMRSVAMQPGPADALVVTGNLGRQYETDSMNLFVAAVREQSSRFCFGDGSAGACPCGNNSSSIPPSGCASGGLYASGTLEDYGVASLGTDSLRFLAGARFGLLIQSSATMPAVPFHSGLLCLSAPIARMYTATANFGVPLQIPPAGNQSVSQRSASSGVPIAPGSTRFYQLLYREQSSACGGSGANLTNAIRVTWRP